MLLWSIPNVAKTVAGPSISVWMGRGHLSVSRFKKVVLLEIKNKAFAICDVFKSRFSFTEPPQIAAVRKKPHADPQF